MLVTSINVGQVQVIETKDGPVRTGIYKDPVAQPTAVGILGLSGDAQADLRHHGGPHRAVYAYPSAHYSWWAQQLGVDLAPGSFGENLTLDGIDERAAGIGDLIVIGPVCLQVSQPRTPCHKLGLRLGRRDVVRLFHDSGRVGFYLRVIEQGVLVPQSRFEHRRVDEPHISVLEVHQQRFASEPDAGRCREIAGQSALSPEWKAWFAERGA